jgi:hypothetical protein
MKIVREVPEKRSGLTFDEQYLQETFDFLLEFEGLKIFDTEHAIDRFKERFPNLSIDRFYDTLKKGLRKILEKYDYQQNFYMIVSRKYKIKIPLQIREDRKDPNILIGAISTLLHSEENPYNKYNEVQVLVEKSKIVNDFQIIKESEELNDIGFYHYVENGEYYKDFEFIEID